MANELDEDIVMPRIVKKQVQQAYVCSHVTYTVKVYLFISCKFFFHYWKKFWTWVDLKDRFNKDSDDNWDNWDYFFKLVLKTKIWFLF